MSYTIEFVNDAVDDLTALRAFDRTRILDEIDAQLAFQPTIPTRRRKVLANFIPPWEHRIPVWELRIGDFRVYYDVEDGTSRVIVRAIRRKPPHRTTSEFV